MSATVVRRRHALTTGEVRAIGWSAAFAGYFLFTAILLVFTAGPINAYAISQAKQHFRSESAKVLSVSNVYGEAPGFAYRAARMQYQTFAGVQVVSDVHQMSASIYQGGSSTIVVVGDDGTAWFQDDESSVSNLNPLYQEAREYDMLGVVLAVLGGCVGGWLFCILVQWAYPSFRQRRQWFSQLWRRFRGARVGAST